MPDRPKACLFDLGGVVLDIDFDLAGEHWANAAGTDWNSIKGGFRRGVEYERHERGELSCEAYFTSIQDDLGISVAAAEMLAGWNAIFRGAIPGIHGELTRARDLGPVFAFSNTNASHIAFLTPRFGDAFSLFDRMFFSHEIGMRKPEERAFLHVAAEMGHAPGDILFFDDGPANVAAAQAAGMQAVLVRSLEDVSAALDGALARR